MTGKCVCTKKYKNSYFPSRVKIIHVFISHHEKTFYSYNIHNATIYISRFIMCFIFPWWDMNMKNFLYGIWIWNFPVMGIFIPSRKMIIIIHIPSRESIRFICHLRKMFKFTTHHGKVSYSYPVLFTRDGKYEFLYFFVQTHFPVMDMSYYLFLYKYSFFKNSTI
jgi:hypothetical protein